MEAGGGAVYDATDVASWSREKKERILVQLGFYSDLHALGHWPLTDDALNAFVRTALDLVDADEDPAS